MKLSDDTPENKTRADEILAFFKGYKAAVRFTAFGPARFLGRAFSKPASNSAFACEIIRDQGDVWLCEFASTEFEALSKCFTIVISKRLDSEIELNKALVPTYVSDSP